PTETPAFRAICATCAFANPRSASTRSAASQTWRRYSSARALRRGWAPRRLATDIAYQFPKWNANSPNGELLSSAATVARSRAADIADHGQTGRQPAVQHVGLQRGR